MHLMYVSLREVFCGRRLKLIHSQENCNWKELSTTFISGLILYLTCAKSCDKFLLLNFEPEDIKVNEPAIKEIVRMGNESLFSWQHPLIKLNGNIMFLINIRSWNGHLKQFLSNKIYLICFSYFYFTEININDRFAKHMDTILDACKDIHKNTQHGLALY